MGAFGSFNLDRLYMSTNHAYGEHHDAIRVHHDPSGSIHIDHLQHPSNVGHPSIP